MGQRLPLFYVYVVELDLRRSMARADLRRSMARADRPGRSSVYVGSTALRPEWRFQRHKAGGMTTSRHVRKNGVRLRPDLYAHLNPFSTREDARFAEQKLGADLRARGFRVFGSCMPREDGCFF